jgi:hypothetical protein
MTRLRLSIATLLCLISIGAWADLRTYDVDFQYRQEFYSALKSLLNLSPEQTLAIGTTGRVELLPSGQILVNATPGSLEQVDQLLRGIRARPPAATPRVSLRYWAVLGTRGPNNANANSGQVSVFRPGGPTASSSTPVPSALDGVLAELKRFHGDLTFRVLGTAAIVSESGQGSEVDGNPLSASQVAHVQGDMLNAEIHIEIAHTEAVGELDVRTSLKRGEFVVLGESTQQGNTTNGTLFYIVHWPE